MERADGPLRAPLPTPCHACLSSSGSLRLSHDLRGLPLAAQLAVLSGPQLHPVSCVDWMRRDGGHHPDQLAAVCPQPHSRGHWICRRSPGAFRNGSLPGSCIRWGGGGGLRGGRGPNPLVGPEAGRLNSDLCPCSSHSPPGSPERAVGLGISLSPWSPAPPSTLLQSL